MSGSAPVGRSALRIATRGSALARWQAGAVAEALHAGAWPGDVEVVVIETTGDRRQDVPVWEMGGQGIFVKEVQSAVLEGRADVAVHSAKDLPSRPAPGLAIAAIPQRADARDALVGGSLEGMSPGALVATGSVRRRAQLAWLRPDLTFTGLRGNIPTRLERIPRGGAVVVALAALQRLGLADRVSDVLDVSVMLPQVGQGAIAVECREQDDEVLAILDAIDDQVAHLCVAAERAFLARLGGGCDLPVGAHARMIGEEVELSGLIASPDGRVLLRDSRAVMPSDALEAGSALADQLLAAGGAALMGDRLGSES